MQNLMRLTSAMAMAVVWLAAPAHSTDQLAFGKKLLIKNPSDPSRNKVVHLAKGASITTGAAGGSGDPQCTGAGGGGGSIRIAASGGAGDVTIALPCGGWSTNGANTMYKYTDPSGVTCKLVLVKSGVLAKAVCTGSQVAIDLNGSMAPVAVRTMLNAQAYCTSFAGTTVKDGSDDRTFLHKDASPPASCPSTTTTSTSSTSSTTSTTVPCPGGALVVGLCWYKGADGADCDFTCVGKGKLYDTATSTYAGSSGSDGGCMAVAAALKPTAAFGGAVACSGGFGCNLTDASETVFTRCTSPATVSTAAVSPRRRLCACH